MMLQLNGVIVDADEANRAEMSGFLAKLGVNVVASLPGSDALPSLLSRPGAPQLVVVNLDPEPQANLKRVASLVRQFSSAWFFVLSQTVDPHLLMEAMHVGVREFVPLPVDAQRFAAGIERVAGLHGMGKRAQVVHLIPSQGGCGSTTVACNIAASLARHHRTVLVDLDLLRGAAAVSFDVQPRFTIADVMASSDKLDPQLLDNALVLHQPSRLAILARPELPEDSQRVSPEGVSRLLSVLGRMYDYVVVDSRMSIDPIYSTVLRAADMNVVVMQLNVPSAKNTERFIGAMRRLGIDSQRIRVVVNRYVKKGWDIAPEEVERTLGLKIDWMIPNDFKNAISAINFGEPVVLRSPKSEMSVRLFELADNLARRAA